MLDHERGLTDADPADIEERLVPPDDRRLGRRPGYATHDRRGGEPGVDRREDPQRRVEALRVERHGAPAGSRSGGHVDDGILEVAAQAGVDRDPVVVEQQGALEAPGRETGQRQRLEDTATVSAESVKPLTSIQPSGSRDGSGSPVRL